MDAGGIGPAQRTVEAELHDQRLGFHFVGNSAAHGVVNPEQPQTLLRVTVVTVVCEDAELREILGPCGISKVPHRFRSDDHRRPVQEVKLGKRLGRSIIRHFSGDGHAEVHVRSQGPAVPHLRRIRLVARRQVERHRGAVCDAPGPGRGFRREGAAGQPLPVGHRQPATVLARRVVAQLESPGRELPHTTVKVERQRPSPRGKEADASAGSPLADPGQCAVGGIDLRNRDGGEVPQVYLHRRAPRNDEIT